TSLAFCALQANLASEQPRNLAADRQPQSGAAKSPTRRTVGLLERLEDQALFVLGDSNSSVRNSERNDLGRRFQIRILESSALVRFANRELDVSLIGELEGIRQEILEHLLQ